MRSYLAAQPLQTLSKILPLRPIRQTTQWEPPLLDPEDLVLHYQMVLDLRKDAHQSTACLDYA